MTSPLQELFDSLAALANDGPSAALAQIRNQPKSTTRAPPSNDQNSSRTRQPKPPPVAQDLQDLNSLARLRCWSAIEQCAATVDSIHHVTLTSAGNAPLHSAISNGAPLSTVQALVVANPPSVALGNNFGNTPLHFAAWKNKYQDSFAIVEFLLEYYPQSAKVVNKHGNLPLHHACNYKAHPDIVQLLYRAYPQAISMSNDKGKTPLDFAIHRFGEKHPVVDMLQGKTNRNYVYVNHRGTSLEANNTAKSNTSVVTPIDVERESPQSSSSSTQNNDAKRYSTAKEDIAEIVTDTWHEVDL